MTLVEFLRARLDEDERVARTVTPARGSGPAMWVLDDDHQHDTLVIDSARVLADVAAKRELIALHRERLFSNSADGYEQNDEGSCDHCLEDYPCPTLRVLALPHADHPDYQQEWAP